ncbi:MAG: CRISPR-associated RAMP protein Csx7, partial [Armatimonadota bacterium]|nr:CRISPR-associated RAMP protein Csx7 [Armatimonadota bacterium]
MARDWEVCFIDVALEAVSGVRVGVGRTLGVEAGTELPVLRNHEGNPLIPGSSLKGVLRSAAERTLRSVDSGVCDPLRSPCVKADEELDPAILMERLCRVCRLFGSQQRAGRIQVGDLVALGARTLVRDGVAIDRRELKAADGLKYDYEVVAPGAVFTGRLRVDDPEEGELGLIIGLLDLVDAGLVTVGGGASRGLGRLRLAEPVRVSRLRASTFQPGTAPEAVDADAERRRFQEPVAA